MNTKDVYKKQFTMAEIAKNDYAVDQLNEMEAAQANLNMDVGNEKLYGKFILAAQKAGANL